MNKYKLDKNEQEILRSVERGEWESAKLSKSELKRYIQAARNTLRKNAHLHIRISERDLEGIKAKAIREGIPYQTLAASVLHKYVNGTLSPTT